MPSDESSQSARQPTRDLAIFGAPPAFSEPRHVGRPNLGDASALHARIAEVLDRGWLTNQGPLVAELEERIKALTSVQHAVAVSNATVGIQLLARALDLEGEVVIPAFTFVGTAHALSWLGLRPVFCEVDPSSHLVAGDAVEQAINARTGAIMGVHLWGHACDADALQAVADAHRIPLLFDASHALGCTHLGSPVGGLGEAEVFSLHATKVVNAAEGGVITTNNDELAHRLRLMRNFGFVFYDTVVDIGTNGKMNELSAAMALTSSDALADIVRTNRRNYSRYSACLESVPGVKLLPHPANEDNNHHYVVIELEESRYRDDLVAVLHAENVLARRYFWPGCHRLPPYSAEEWNLPVTDEVCGRVVVLPTGTSVAESDVDTICAIIHATMESAADVHEHLSVRTPEPG